MAKKLSLKSTYNEVGWSLRETLDQIERNGETKELKYDMLLKYGWLKFLDNDPDGAYRIFSQCSTHAIDNGILDIDELFYWAARCLEEKGDKENALNGYLSLLESSSKYQNNEELINEIFDRLKVYGDIPSLLREYENKHK